MTQSGHPYQLVNSPVLIRVEEGFSFVKYSNELVALLLLVGCSPALAEASERNSPGFAPGASIDDTRELLVFLVSWLEHDLADAHRIYPIYGDVKTISIGDGYGMYGERKYLLARDGRVTGKESKKREYNVEKKQRENVLISRRYLYEKGKNDFESRVHCNGRFYERHVFAIDEEKGLVNRFSYYPDGTRESVPTITLAYDPETRTLLKREMYVEHKGICDPNWDIAAKPIWNQTTFVFSTSGFVIEIVAGEDPTDKRYLHWQFVPNENGIIEDTILMPDTPQFRSEVVNQDRFGNPTLIKRYYAVTNFGTVDFEYYDETEFRHEYYGE